MCAFLHSHAQKNYLPGFIITLEGDTLTGLIKHRNWEIKPDNISFKALSGIRVKKYSPIDIIGFGTQDEIYESAVVQTEISPIRTNSLELNSKLHFRIDTVFLQAVIQGNKSLYYYINKEGKNQFYIKKGNHYELLVYKRYIKRGSVVELNKYLGQVRLYLDNHEGIQSAINNTEYNKKSLSKLFSQYYKNTQTELKYQKKHEKFTSEFGALAGISISSLEFSNNGIIPYLSEVDFDHSVNFSAGFFADFIFPKFKKRWSFYSDLLYTEFSFNAHYDVITGEQYFKYIDSELSYSYLKLNNMLRYRFLTGKTKAFINAGISNGIVLSETNSKVIVQKQYSTDRVDYAEAIASRKHEQSYVLGLGIKRNKLLLDVRYEKGNGMSDVRSVNSKIDRFYFMVGYQF